MDEAQLSKADLVRKIKEGKFKRPNGKRVHLSARYLDQMLCTDSDFWRSPHVALASALATVLNKDAAWAVALVQWTPRSKPVVAPAPASTGKAA